MHQVRHACKLAALLRLWPVNLLRVVYLKKSATQPANMSILACALQECCHTNLLLCQPSVIVAGDMSRRQSMFADGTNPPQSVDIAAVQAGTDRQAPVLLHKIPYSACLKTGSCNTAFMRAQRGYCACCSAYFMQQARLAHHAMSVGVTAR